MKSFLKKIKKIWCSIKCCFSSSCKVETKDNDNDGIPDEINIRRNSL